MNVSESSHASQFTTARLRMRKTVRATPPCLSTPDRGRGWFFVDVDKILLSRC